MEGKHANEAKDKTQINDEMERGMKSYPKVIIGILTIVIIIVLGIGALVILDVYRVEASVPGNYSTTGVSESNSYPPPEPDLCPGPYPPPYPSPYPVECLSEYLPLLHNNSVDIVLDD